MTPVLTDIDSQRSTGEGEIRAKLERRLGRVHASQRLGIEQDHESIFGHGINFFHIENWYSAQSLLRGVLKLAGMYKRGCLNAEDVRVRHNRLAFQNLPSAFEGFTILHVSDLHADKNLGAMRRLVEILPGLEYDLCVLTGDYRGETYGPFAEAMKGVAGLRPFLKGPVYGVLGNHDTIQMVPALEDMGIHMLLNESVPITRGGERIHLAGIDDAHYYRVDNFEKAAAGIPHQEFSVLLSHTPEVYRQAAHADFDLLLAGHTHAGQICLPGGVPIILESKLPRRLGAGSWTYHKMVGYTSAGAGSSLVAVRFNCPPEITLHRLGCR